MTQLTRFKDMTSNYSHILKTMLFYQHVLAYFLVLVIFKLSLSEFD